MHANIKYTHTGPGMIRGYIPCTEVTTTDITWLDWGGGEGEGGGGEGEGEGERGVLWIMLHNQTL